MATLFTARRKPKRVAREEPDNLPDDGDEGTLRPRLSPTHVYCMLLYLTLLRQFSVIVPADGEYVDTGPVVRRPTHNAPRTKSKLRVSFNPGEEDGSGAGEAADSGAAPQIKSATRLGLSTAAQDILTRRDHEDREGEGQNHDRPKYNKAYLDELRNSTPSTPRDLSSRGSPSLDLVEPSANLELDLESKFGKPVTLSSAISSHIPSAAEIREKKDRRARLAKEQAAGSTEDFIALEDYDSDGEFKPRRMQVSSYLVPPREKETRLVREDEDIAEGFDDFVEDTGRVTLSKKGLREQSRKEKEAIRNLINEAEGGSPDNSLDGDGGSASDSDYERRREYELAQTQHGMDGLSSHAVHKRQLNRPRQPRETTLIPKLSVGLTRLRDMVSALEFERAKIVKRKADIEREKAEIKQSQDHIQRSLEEAGQELERVRREHAERVNGARSGTPMETDGRHMDSSTPAAAVAERGLESFGDHHL
ncbi:uncharacterized protein Z519_07671 [Cladophialophora bantiana CBS 173.52]|uniref:Uncharacterized protein n=1 Tax=Cladophialophora bantiana (strain ATCC 10958 / CBS 173.52 / CDC B-1940 / NIH 8579) TaxID=1442370 RepID=A0A0D2HEI5_CLAB1|nr:uncharacterized protein Z519_07671 [Cladophialophora bantiana CBS 173.52]KIW91703.1 hypothetical protein Z519_07671 [Cladophialophora bantiana CBS 173.52]